MTLLQVNRGSTLSIPHAQTINGPLTVNGNLSVGYGTVLTMMDNLNIGNGASGQWSIDLQHAATWGTASQIIDLSTVSSATFGNGAIIQVVNPPLQSATIPLIRNGTSVNNISSVILPNAMFTQYMLQRYGTSGLNLVVIPLSATDLDNVHNHGVATALDALRNMPLSGVLLALETQFVNGSFTSVQQYNDNLQSVAPQVSRGVLQGSFNLMTESFLASIDRLDYLRLSQTGGIATGYAAGDPTFYPGAWAKVLGQHGNQQRRDGIEGYKDNSWGLAFGFDTFCDEGNMVAGIGFTWSTLKVQTLETKSTTHANSYQGTLYGGYNFDCPWFVDGLFAIAYNDYDASRNVIFGNLRYSPQSDYHGLQLGAKVDAGYDYIINAFHIVPLGSLTYAHLGLSSYTETHAGNAAQHVNAQDFGMFLAGLGLEIAYDLCITDGKWLRPEIHAQAFYDFIDDMMQTTSIFTGGGPSFVTPGVTPPRWMYNVGASFLTFEMDSGLSASVTYDYNFQHDYEANSGFFRIQYIW